jgi:hypothetical protein
MLILVNGIKSTLSDRRISVRPNTGLIPRELMEVNDGRTIWETAVERGLIA